MTLLTMSSGQAMPLLLPKVLSVFFYGMRSFIIVLVNKASFLQMRMAAWGIGGLPVTAVAAEIVNIVYIYAYNIKDNYKNYMHIIMHLLWSHIFTSQGVITSCGVDNSAKWFTLCQRLNASCP